MQNGEHIEAGKPVFALVRTNDYWIQVNIKEVKLTHLAVGQKATVVLDAYPNVTWDAVVDSISPATGAEFSLLPAQNATGNWVKVVQRVPLRLKLEPKTPAPALRAGMTANHQHRHGSRARSGGDCQHVLAEVEVSLPD